MCKEQWKYCQTPWRLHPMEFIRSPPLKSGRENYDRLECNWCGGPTLPLNALSAVFWCRVGSTWKRRKKRPREKRKNGRDDDDEAISACSERRGASRRYARRGRNRAGTKKIRRKAGLIRAPPPPELIDCRESAGERSFLLFYCHTRGDTALARFLPTDKLVSARLPRVINRWIALLCRSERKVAWTGTRHADAARVSRNAGLFPYKIRITELIELQQCVFQDFGK